jgi:hypothetical protein
LNIGIVSPTSAKKLSFLNISCRAPELYERGHARSTRYLKARMVLESREMSSSNWTSLTPSCSMREVKTPYGNGRILATAMSRTGASWAVVKTSSDSIVLHPPAEASSAMMFWKRQLGRREARRRLFRSIGSGMLPHNAAYEQGCLN